MKDVMGIIYTGEKDSFLRELTLQRAIAAVPCLDGYFYLINKHLCRLAFLCLLFHVPGQILLSPDKN